MKWDCTVHIGWSKNNRLLSNPHKHTSQHTDLTNCCWLALFSRYSNNHMQKKLPCSLFIHSGTDSCLPGEELITSSWTTWQTGSWTVSELKWCHVLIKRGVSANQICSAWFTWSLCSMINEKFEMQTRAKVLRMRRWTASHLEDGSRAVMNGEDVCDVVSG